VAELELYATHDGKVSYRPVRELRFPSRFSLRDARGRRYAWTPCREDAADDPQLEGLVVDQDEDVLYANQEVIGLWKLSLRELSGRVVEVDPIRLVEPVTSFGAPYWALPDDDEFSCEEGAPAELPEGSRVQAGSDAQRGAHITADAEGLAIYYGRHGRGYLIASSQGDDTFHVFARHGGFTRRSFNAYEGSFIVEGAGETDGHEVVSVPGKTSRSRSASRSPPAARRVSASGPGPRIPP
jgi:3-phytase